jgi:anti-anti-sigma factor
MQPVIDVIEFKGHLILSSGQRLIDTVNQHIKSDITTLLIDLHLVKFMDSAGLAALVRICKLSQGVGIQVSLCSARPQVKFLLDISCIGKIFKIFENRQAFYDSWIQEFPKDALLPSVDELRVTRVEGILLP